MPPVMANVGRLSGAIDLAETMTHCRNLVGKLVGTTTLAILGGLTTYDTALASSPVSADTPSPVVATTTPDCPKPQPRPNSKPKAQPKPAPQPHPFVCPTCPPVLPPVVCPPTAIQPVDEAFWSRYGKDTFFSLFGVVLGMLVSFYATILFERYKRFRETLLDIAKGRQHNEAYPISTKNLLPVYERAIEYWRLLESKQWTLNADGHVEAAAQVGRLLSRPLISAYCAY